MTHTIEPQLPELTPGMITMGMREIPDKATMTMKDEITMRCAELYDIIDQYSVEAVQKFVQRANESKSSEEVTSCNEQMTTMINEINDANRMIRKAQLCALAALDRIT